MNNGTSAVNKEAKNPSNDEENCYKIQKVTHDILFRIQTYAHTPGGALHNCGKELHHSHVGSRRKETKNYILAIYQFNSFSIFS
jgi:hypothetical protein